MITNISGSIDDKHHRKYHAYPWDTAILCSVYDIFIAVLPSFIFMKKVDMPYCEKAHICVCFVYTGNES